MLTPLASSDDLAARGITVPSTMDEDVLLGAASWSIRDAAGCAITQATSTVTLIARDRCELDLPAGPVTAVGSVTVNSVPVTAWRKIGDTIMFTDHQWVDVLPAEVVVAYTHGYAVIPDDIVDLTCSLVAQAAAGGEYGGDSRIAATRLGDYSETLYHPAGTESPSPLSLPDNVRQRLRVRFGTSVAAVPMKAS